eukprot:s1827_g1.t1
MLRGETEICFRGLGVNGSRATKVARGRLARKAKHSLHPTHICPVQQNEHDKRNAVTSGAEDAHKTLDEASVYSTDLIPLHERFENLHVLSHVNRRM